MASPQLEDGYTAVANEILDAFCLSFPGGSNAQVLLAIIRRTYGWHKKDDKISISQLCEMTGRCRRTVIYALQNLEAQGFITVQRQRGRGIVNQINTVAFQKNHELWVVQRNSPQWEKQLQNKREKYQREVVQRKKQPSAENPQNTIQNGSAEKEGSAENGQKVVQRNDATMQFSAPTKDNIQKIITKDNKENNKRKHGEFQNVLLTDEEYQKLKDRFPNDMEARIEKLSGYMESTGKRYKSHYATILNWSRTEKEGKVGANRNPRDLPKTYADSPNYPDLA
jgi:phage replication O-like protein O